MRKPMAVLSMLYVLGIWFQYVKQPLLWIIIFLVFLFLGWKQKHQAKKYWMYGLLVFSLICTGVVNFAIQNNNVGTLKPFWNKEVEVVGNVLQATYRDDLQLNLEVEKISFEEKIFSVEEKIIVKLYGEEEFPQSLVGKKIKILGMMREPQRSRNPKTFDYRAYLKTKGIYSMIYSRADRLEIMGEGEIGILLKLAYDVKSRVIDMMGHTLPEKEAGLLLGILLGDKERLDLEIYDNFRKVGIAHVLAVSGLYVGILYMVLNHLLTRVSVKIRVPVLLIVLWFYVVVTGFSPSVMRATSMATLLILAPTFNRKYDSLSAICTVLFFFLLLNPLMLMDIGFQLSFMAVLAIVLLYKPLYHRLGFLPDYWAQLIAVSFAAQIGVIPLTAYHFNQVSIVALLINIPIVLLVGYIVPLGLATLVMGILSIEIATWISGVNLILIKIMIWLSNVAESIPFSSLQRSSPSFWFMVTYYVLFVLWATKDNRLKKYKINKKKSMLVIASLYLVITIAHWLVPKEMEITFVDVGQGDCILIRTPKGRNVLVDAGGNGNPVIQNNQAGKNIVMPYLLKNSVEKIDLAILSHVHSDHMGGFLDLFKNFKVEGLMIGTDAYETEEWKLLRTECDAKKIKIYQVCQGDRISLEEDLIINILHPGKDLLEVGRDPVNNNSLVMLLQYQDKKILFTGDIEKEAEEVLIKNYPDLDIDVLKVAHHGSVYSSTDAFIQGVKPEIAVVTVGKNSFGHPHPQILDKFYDQGIAVHRTDQHGAVTIKINGEDIKIQRTLEMDD